MAKRVQKAVRKKPIERPEDERRRLELRYTRRALREHKEIQRLARQLQRAIRVTRGDLFNLAAWLAGREYRIVPRDQAELKTEAVHEPSTV